MSDLAGQGLVEFVIGRSTFGRYVKNLFDGQKIIENYRK